MRNVATANDAKDRDRWFTGIGIGGRTETSAKGLHTKIFRLLTIASAIGLEPTDQCKVSYSTCSSADRIQ
jgi:hypothetical protein